MKPEQSAPRPRLLQRAEATLRRVARRRRRLHTAALVARGLVPRRDTTPRVYVLCYHDIGSASARSFRDGLRALARVGPFLSWDDCLQVAAGEGHTRGPAFCLTFDDAYRSWVTSVLPVLNELGLPAMFFVATGEIGQRASSLTWPQCRTLVDAGMSIGSHSHSHRPLLPLDDDAVRDELAASKATLEDRLGIKVQDFCAPFGQPWQTYRPDRDTVLAAEVGYRSFVTTVRGAVRPGDSPFAVKRLTMEPEWPRLALLGRLEG